MLDLSGSRHCPSIVHGRTRAKSSDSAELHTDTIVVSWGKIGHVLEFFKVFSQPMRPEGGTHWRKKC